MNRVIILGQQGSGKSTLAALLTNALIQHDRYTPESVRVTDEAGEGHREPTCVTAEFPMTQDGRVELTEIFLINADAPMPLDNPDEAFGTMDAEKWADGFMTCVLGNPSIPYDKGTLIGYFANAIMKGYDSAVAKHEALIRYAKAVEKLVQCDLHTDEFVSFNSGDMYSIAFEDDEVKAAFDNFVAIRKELIEAGYIVDEDNRLYSDTTEPLDASNSFDDIPIKDEALGVDGHYRAAKDGSSIRFEGDLGDFGDK